MSQLTTQACSATSTVMVLGDVLSLADTCPARVLVFDEDGCWVASRAGDALKGWATYRVLAAAEDPEETQRELDHVATDPVGAVRDVFEGVQVVFDRTELEARVDRLIGFYAEQEPEVMGCEEWIEVQLAQGAKLKDLIEAVERVLVWCGRVSPKRLERDGWKALQAQVNNYYTAYFG